MIDSPPSGRAYPRAPFACSAAVGRGRVNAPLLLAIALSALLALVLVIGAQPAGAKKKRKDKRSPYVVKSSTVDADGNGRVDGIAVTYSEKIRYTKIRQGKGKAKKKNRKKLPWHSTGVHKYLGVNVLPDGKSVLVSIAEADAMDTAECPAIAYFRVPKGARGVTDRAGNQALMALIKPVDAIAPRLVSASTRDNNGNGRVDTLSLVYSEPVQSPAVGQFTATGYPVSGAAAGGENVTLSLAEQGVDTQATPGVSAGAGAVKDAAGNDQAGEQSVAATDGAAPSVIDAVTGDTNVNGRIDLVRVRFSEPVTHVAETGVGAVTASGFPISSVSAAQNDSVDVLISDSVGGFNTGVKPTVETSATASPVKDAAGNMVGATTFAGTRDGAAPALISAKTKDATGNGYIDAIVSTFSEPVSYTAGVSSYFSTTTAELSAFSGAATAVGATVTAAVTEDTLQPYNTNLPSASPVLPLPISYTPPGSGGAVDSAGMQAAAKTVQASDGAGPAIVYAETVDDNLADGHIDGIKIGFSEPIATLVGNPFSIARGTRIVVDLLNVPTDGSKIISAGAPGDPLYKGVSVPVYPLTTNGSTNGPLADPDTADKPTVDYATVISGSVRTAYAEDAAHNEVIATGANSFSGTLDKVPPILLTLQAEDAVLDGSVDRLRTVWSEPVATNGSPSFAELSPLNGPLGGYTPPTVKSVGATANGFSVVAPLNLGSDPDRDMVFESQYTPSGPSDSGVSDRAGNNAIASPTLTSAPSCTDADESSSTGQDDSAPYANATGLDTVSGSHLSTLCGGDADYYEFAAVAGQTESVLLAPAPAALATRAGNAYDPFDVSGPGGSVSLSSLTFDDTTGWIGKFTAASTGNYTVGVRDALSPLLDYGYCISRTADGSDPTCSVRQGDMIITEVLRDRNNDPPSVGPYVEIKNVSAQPRTIDDTFELLTNGSPCTLQPYVNLNPALSTDTTIQPGGTFYVSNTDDPAQTNDFSCAGMDIQFGLPITLKTQIGGTIDNVGLSSVSAPPAYSVQLRSSSQWETSTANDDIAGGWCLSADTYGSWGKPNNNCDQFRLSEVSFLPSTASRDGRVYVEISGVGALTPSSTLLAGWRVRIKPQGLPGAFFVLPPNANPNSDGDFVLADSPATGVTQVPLYSAESANLQAGDSANGGAIDGRTLDQYLRADRPVTVKLMRPASGDPLTCDVPAVDTFGFSPTSSGTLTGADSDGVCGSAYTLRPFAYPFGGYDASIVLQRDHVRTFVNDNQLDFCPALPTPMRTNYECNSAT